MKSPDVIPRDYRPLLGLVETERAIRLIKEFFQTNLAQQLNLLRVTAPLFVRAGTGLNDDLSGVERPVAFEITADGNARAEIVQSLAKWKRMALAQYGMTPGEGLYTDMNAIRPCETLDNLHSIYVDQWDWEKVITRDDRSLDFLRATVDRIYRVMRLSEEYIAGHYPAIRPLLPEKIEFLHAEDLEERYPEMSPKEREAEACRSYGAVFIIGIGAPLKSGRPHDGRAPDYDDWSTPTVRGCHGLNGDILVWHPVLHCPFEISSMGIRVDAEALDRQLQLSGQTGRRELLFHQRLLRGELPLSIGGGIGQSRLCMFFLRKAHIGEVQASIWPEEVRAQCRKAGVTLL